MGSNHSSASSRKVRREPSDEKSVHFLEHDEELSPGERAGRRLISMYSKKGKKEINQDAAVVFKDFGTTVFIGVFDGHGPSGHRVSQMVRDRLPFLLHNSRYQLTDTENGELDPNSCQDSSVLPTDHFDEWKNAFPNAYKVMDSELEAQQKFNCLVSGTTAVSLIKQGRDLVVANLGDSRAVIGSLTENGRLVATRLTNDHKPSVDAEAERITSSKGRVFSVQNEEHITRVWLPDADSPGLAMTRSFGDFQLKKYGVICEPEVSHIRLTSRDQFIVLATDGVWDVLSNEQVVSIISSTKNKENAAKKLVESAVKEWETRYPHSSVDDCCVVCLFLQDIET